MYKSVINTNNIILVLIYYILVLKSKCNTYEGLSGIVLKDNMRSFEIIT